MSPGIRRLPLAALAVVLAAAVTACAPDPSPAPTRSAPGPTASGSPTGAPTPTPTATAVALPTDCRAILSESVLAQLDGQPLNDPAFGADAGVQADGSLVCIWGPPDTDTGRLQTTISRMSRGPALDLMNQLGQERDYSCYTPSGGTRCEATWIDPQYPVTDGRTLFWRDDIMIDTSYAGLAPSGYTDSVISHLFD